VKVKAALESKNIKAKLEHPEDKKVAAVEVK